mmetsp:Transcript_115012/g.365446  ORF Transcript_115012/g.365446 Transcript_115012/m.365446 type:complete len:90 (+) Transcript_115012:81-350(+)
MSVAVECKQVVKQAVKTAIQNCGVELFAEFAVASALQVASEEAVEEIDWGELEEVLMEGPAAAEDKPGATFDFNMPPRPLLSNAPCLGS